MNQPPLPALFPLAGPLPVIPPVGRPVPPSYPGSGPNGLPDGDGTAALLRAQIWPEGKVQVGTSLPGQPAPGLFLWKTTGRSWLMLWDGTAWTGLFADGASALFVDTALGTDTPGNGTAAGASAYKTIQYAVNQIPGLVNGNVTVTAATGTYAETVTVQGKNFTGNFSITIIGTKAADSLGPTTATSGANPAGNGSAGYGTITKTGATWTVNAWQNKFIEITSGTGNGQVFVVHANTATVATIVGQWTTVPDATSVFHIYDPGTKITGTGGTGNNGFNILAAQQSVNLQQLWIQSINANGATYSGGASGGILRCRFDQCIQGVAYFSIASGSVSTSCFTASGQYDVQVSSLSSISGPANCRMTGTAAGVIGIFCQGSSAINPTLQCYISQTSSTSHGTQVVDSSFIVIEDYQEIDGGTTSGDNYSVQAFGVVTQSANVPATIVSKNSAGWGLNAAQNGFGQAMQGITYATNTLGTFNPVTAPAGWTN